jgi:hypothetical protein
MQLMPQRPPNYSTTCPKCGDDRGVVRAAATVVGMPDQINVTLECPSCRHEWHQQFEQKNRLGKMVSTAPEPWPQWSARRAR